MTGRLMAAIAVLALWVLLRAAAPAFSGECTT